MAYLTPSDFTRAISQIELDDILDSDPTLLDDSIATAESEMISFLSRYDTSAAILSTAADRDSLLVTRLVDMALYHMYSVVSPTDVPELRMRRYSEAIKLFEAVSRGQRELNFPLKSDSKGKSSYLKWGQASIENGFDFFAY